MIDRPKLLRRSSAVILVVGMIATGCSSSDPAHVGSTATSSQTQAVVRRPAMVVYRTPSCGCCKSYEDYLRKHGVTVESEVLDDLTQIRADNGVPDDASSCHTVLVDGYVVEGHVPLEAIDQMLEDRPAIDGIAIPGMPTNAPGMGEPDGRPIEVVSFTDGRVAPFTTL